VNTKQQQQQQQPHLFSYHLLFSDNSAIFLSTIVLERRQKLPERIIALFLAA